MFLSFAMIITISKKNLIQISSTEVYGIESNYYKLSSIILFSASDILYLKAVTERCFLINSCSSNKAKS